VRACEPFLTQRRTPAGRRCRRVALKVVRNNQFVRSLSLLVSQWSFIAMYGTDHLRYRRSAAGSRSSSDRHQDEWRDRHFHFTTAIVCRVSNSLADQTSFERHPVRADGDVDVAKCRTELERLVEVLRHGAGLDVVELPSDEQQPDGLFVGDIAVVIGGVALICNPPNVEGLPSRHGEVRARYYSLQVRPYNETYIFLVLSLVTHSV
jgi:hypothetical protein